MTEDWEFYPTITNTGVAHYLNDHCSRKKKHPLGFAPQKKSPRMEKAEIIARKMLREGAK